MAQLKLTLDSQQCLQWGPGMSNRALAASLRRLWERWHNEYVPVGSIAPNKCSLFKKKKNVASNVTHWSLIRTIVSLRSVVQGEFSGSWSLAGSAKIKSVLWTRQHPPLVSWELRTLDNVFFGVTFLAVLIGWNPSRYVFIPLEKN